ncbi:hypothetical protein FBU59_002706 [Linderina macrospora]|uniref:Uncharacterized protein n=1 Tax=Linderina macrospora TaxID=4868 RepID=A0ACC1JAP3_9FUNG|nr:hypothetical protein FBU59_002706 [Linderina macrospora]
MNGDDERPKLGFDDSSDEEAYNETESLLHRRGQKSKEERMLGVWADDNADSDQVVHRASRINPLKPIGFVSGESAGNMDVVDPSEGAANTEKQPAGTSDQPTQPLSTKEKDMAEIDGSSSSESSGSDSSSDSSDSDSSDDEEKGEVVKKPAQAAPSKDFGKFANSTVWSMMEKMGYKHGEGLGRHGEGRIEPVEVTLRRAGEGISYSGSERPRSEQPKPKVQPKGWGSKPQSGASTPRASGPRTGPRKKAQYKTLDELQKTTEQTYREIFVDMTTNTEVASMAELAAKKPDVNAKDKLASEVRLGLDLALSRQDSLVREKEVEEKRLEGLQREMRALALSVDQRRTRIEHLRTMKEEVANVLSVASETSVESAESAEDDLAKLYAEYERMYKMAGLAQEASGFDVWAELSLEKVVTSTAYGFHVRAFRTWEPAGQPDLIAKLVSPILKYTSINEAGTLADEMTPVESLLNRTAVPRLRQFLHGQWDPLSDDLVQILDGLPPVVTQVVADDVSTVLQRFVDNINPRLVIERYRRMQDKSSDDRAAALADLRIDRVLLPWLPLIHDHDALLTAIRSKLCTALDKWTPTKESNGDIIALVSPWFEIFDGKDLRRLSAKVSSRLEDMLRAEFHFDAQRQVVWPFKAVLKWHPILPFESWFAVVRRGILSGFVTYLRRWLADPEANYAEIADWYWTWKSLYPPEIFERSEVQQEFRKALVYMSYAMSLREQAQK